MNNFLQALKAFSVSALDFASIGLRSSFFPGAHVFGRNVYLLSRFRFRPTWSEGSSRERLGAWNLVERLASMGGELLLDVGAGSLEHSKYFASKGKKVTAIDLGTSPYALKKVGPGENEPNIELLNTDFNLFVSEDQWDIVWASHILEHQKNVGHFLSKCLGHTKESGLLVFVLPFPHKEIWGGHLTYWTPGLLAYNLVLAGTSMLESSAFESHGEFVLVLRKNSVDLSRLALAFDSGDVSKISHYLPKCVDEGSSSFVYWDSLGLKNSRGFLR